MLIKWFIFCLLALPITLTIGNERKCPAECTCDLDELNRYQTICIKGGLIRFPAESLDNDVQVIIIQGPRNSVTTGNSLRSFRKLEVIRITDSNVPVIGPECLWGLQHLKILDFSKNNISHIQQRDFRGQNNLLELDLSKNKIINMASSVFCNLTELRRLNLADNSIGELVQRIFFMLSKLSYLDLSNNPLQELPPDVFRDVSQLKVFKCRNCQLKKVNPQLYNLLPQLTELDMGRNEFKFLDKDEFRDVKRLTKVLMDGNQLSVVIDELFRMQKSLKHLDLSYNRLAKIPNDSFLSLSNLTFLDLSYNKLVRLEPQSVRRLGNLQTLNISGNIHMDLHEIRETFNNIPHLTHLSIADMGVLPAGLLQPFKNLRYLNISGNHLDSLSLQVIEPCQGLEFLDLSRNQLNGINDEIVLRIQAIRNVRLDNNPLICDECHMGKLIDVVRQLQFKWDTYPICFLPKPLRGSEITDVDSNALDSCLEYITDEEQNAVASSTSHNFLEANGLNTLAILGGIIFVLIAIIIISIGICFSKHRARYYTREDHLNGSEDKCLEKNLDSITIKAAHGNVKGDIKMPAAHTSPTNGSLRKKSLTTTTLITDSGNGLDALANEPLNPNCNGNDNSTSPTTNEINFKFPIDDRVCTIDELVMVTPGTNNPATITHSGVLANEDVGGGAGGSASANSFAGCNNMSLRYSASPISCGSTTAKAAVAAAATVIPPGAPSTGVTATSSTMLGTVAPAAAARTTVMPMHHATLPPDAIIVVLPPPSHHQLHSAGGGAAASGEQQYHQHQYNHQKQPYHNHHLQQQQQSQHQQQYQQHQQLQQQQNHQQNQQQQQQQQQQMLQLTTLEPLVSVN